jgi:hypothetical protein
LCEGIFLVSYTKIKHRWHFFSELFDTFQWFVHYALVSLVSHFSDFILFIFIYVKVFEKGEKPEKPFFLTILKEAYQKNQIRKRRHYAFHQLVPPLEKPRETKALIYVSLEFFDFNAANFTFTLKEITLVPQYALFSVVSPSDGVIY